MNRELVLTVLYDLALTIGSEVESRKLLDKTLRRLLYHTGFPAGVVLERVDDGLETESVKLVVANGDHVLGALVNTTLMLPKQLLEPKVALLARPEWLAAMCAGQIFSHCLRLPVGESIVVLLLATCKPESQLPLTHVFQPILANLAKAVGLSRESERLRESIVRERDQAQAERDDARIEVENERSFLNTLYETLPDLVWLKDANGVYLTCNALFGRLYGTQPGEIIGKTDYDFVDAELADFFRANDLAAAAVGKPKANEETLTFAADGYCGRFHTIKTPMFNKHGQFIGVLGVARDISEQHRLLESLREREAELKNQQRLLEERVYERTRELGLANVHLEQTQFAMDRAGIGMHWVDATSGRLLVVNRHAAYLLGYSVDELLTLTVPEIDGSLSEEAFRQLAVTMSQQKTLSFDSTQRHKNGQLIPVNVSLYFVAATSSYPAHYITFITDITVRKEAEEALRQAKDVAEQATLAKSTFLANMSHEIRTPMNAIIGMTSLMRRAGVSSKQGEQLEVIDHASHHLLEVINNILDLSKIEAGKMEVECVPFNLADMLRSIGAVMGGLASAKGLGFRVRVAGLPQNYAGDETRLKQALLNFLGNAIKFTECGSVTLSGQVLEERSDDYLLRFEVTDTGPGITQEEQALLFQPFTQVDGSITRRYGGTGLGLVISQHIAELMGGEAGVDSRPGDGSTFWLTVRLGKGSGMPAEVAKRQTSVEDELRACAADVRILLVEDDLINQEVALSLLEDVGLSADVAGDGLEALARVRVQAYDLILMDMQMPRLDGVGATQKIRKIPNGRDTPIIAMTANAFAEDRLRCLEAGMNDFLSKPVDPEVLFAKVLKWLKEPVATLSESPAR